MSIRGMLLSVVALSALLFLPAFAADAPNAKPTCCEKKAYCCTVKSPCCGKSLELEMER